MKKNAIILIILSSCLGLTAQTGTFVNGVVLDAVNGTPMPYVSRPLQDSNVLKNQLFLNFSFSIFRFESLFFHFRLFYLSFFVLESDNSLHSLLFGS